MKHRSVEELAWKLLGSKPSLEGRDTGLGSLSALREQEAIRMFGGLWSLGTECRRLSA